MITYQITIQLVTDTRLWLSLGPYKGAFHFTPDPTPTLRPPATPRFSFRSFRTAGGQNVTSSVTWWQ